MPTLPLAQSANTGVLPSRVVNAGARPLSQSTTDFTASFSFGAPSVGQPSDQPVPGFSTFITAKPRGTHWASYEVEMTGLVSLVVKSGWNGRCGWWAAISTSAGQLPFGPRAE